MMQRRTSAASSGISPNASSPNAPAAASPSTTHPAPAHTPPMHPVQKHLAARPAPERHASGKQDAGKQDSGTQEGSETLTPKQRDHSKQYSIIEGSFASASVGMTDSFLTAFAVALGSTNAIIALLATLPRLIGAILQLWSSTVLSFFSSRKRYIVTFAFLQSLMWLPLLFAPQLQHTGGYLILFVTLNTVFGLLISPVWNSFMGDVIEESERGRFFGRRNMFTGMTAFVGTLFAGWLLFVLKPTHPLLGFLILFGLAFLFRAASAFYLSRMDDPPERGLGNESPDVIEFLRNADKNPFGRFTLFVCLFYIAVYLSAPFFAVYQLTILKLDYMTFTFLACASAIASFLSMILWGKYVDRIGSKNVLVTTGFLIPLVPLIYALTTSLPLLIMTELMSGLLWAGFNLSMSTYIFDATDRKNRTREVAEYTLLLQVATFFGAMAGSGILGLFDRTQPDGYVALFLASAMLRLAVVILFYKALQELRIVEIPVKDRLYKKFVSVRPQMGIQYEVAGENLRAAGKIATETPRQVRDEVVAFARKAREKHPVSKMKQMESQEDAQDMDAYQRRMQKKG